MAYKNNGTSRSLKIKVYKDFGSNPVQGYPKTYDGQQSWGNLLYPTLTDIEARRLSDAAFSARYLAFATYVASIEGTLDFNTDISGPGPTKTDNTCLVITTTTTTVAPQPNMRMDFISADGILEPDVQDGEKVNMLSLGSGVTGQTYSCSFSAVNTGDADLIITAITAIHNEGNQFQSTLPPLPVTIPPTFLNGFTVEFNGGLTAAAGIYTSIWQITTNDPDTPVIEIELEITII